METIYLPISYLRDIIKTPHDVSVVLQERWKYSGGLAFHRTKVL